MMRLPLPKHDIEPDSPKYPTADFAHSMAEAIVKGKKKKKKKGKLDIELEV